MIDPTTEKGFLNSFQGMERNTNYEARNTTDHKTDGIINEFSGVLTYKSSLPMKKEKNYSSNIFSPTFMVRYAPGHLRDLSGKDGSLNYANLYSTIILHQGHLLLFIRGFLQQLSHIICSELEH